MVDLIVAGQKMAARRPANMIVGVALMMPASSSMSFIATFGALALMAMNMNSLVRPSSDAAEGVDALTISWWAKKAST